jgi:hypothetical protein
VSTSYPARFVPVPRREPFSCSYGIVHTPTYSRTHLALIRVIFRPHALRATFEHARPAYLEEHFPIDVVLTNLDNQELEFEVDVLMQPTADESGVLTLRYRWSDL